MLSQQQRLEGTDALTRAVEEGLARVNGEGGTTPAPLDLDAVRGQFREWVAAQAFLRNVTEDVIREALR